MNNPEDQTPTQPSEAPSPETQASTSETQASNPETQADPSSALIPLDEVQRRLGRVALLSMQVEIVDGLSEDAVEELMFQLGATMTAGFYALQDESDDDGDTDTDQGPVEIDDADYPAEELDDEYGPDDEEEDDDRIQPTMRVRELVEMAVTNGVDLGWTETKTANKSATGPEIRAAQVVSVMSHLEAVMHLDADPEDDTDGEE